MDGQGDVNRSEAKVLLGKKKRDFMDIEETTDSSCKKVKMRDVESILRSEGKGCSELPRRDVNSGSALIDLNMNLGPANDTYADDASECVNKSSKLPTTKHEVSKYRGFNLDLNVNDISSSANDPFYPYKNYEYLKSRDESECGSSIGPLDENDSMRVWKGLKQNNYMSTLHGSVPIPKPRGRKKSNNDAMKKRIELARKEQVDRFAKIAAPSGLLNGLNPGIINHVRNSKQVHSIIEAIVKSERNENQSFENRQVNQNKNVGKESNERKKETALHSSDRSGSSQCGFLMGRRHVSESGLFPYPITEGHYREFTRISSSQCSKDNVDDGLALKLSSSLPVASENTSCLSNEESGNLTSVTSLSIKAANVASQWLELLSQDIKGRLSALRRSKKRVRAVITTELPSLLSREFSSSNQSKDYSYNASKDSNILGIDHGITNGHSAQWSSLFDQMEKSLSEEEIHLEKWLNQVKEMQVHCEKGLYKTSQCLPPQQQAGFLGNNNRSGEVEDYSEELAVNAAAASIYSTCNFLMSMENLPCC